MIFINKFEKIDINCEVHLMMHLSVSVYFIRHILYTWVVALVPPQPATVHKVNSTGSGLDGKDKGVTMPAINGSTTCKIKNT